MFPTFVRILSLCLCLAAWSAAEESQAVQDTTIPCPESGCPPVPAHILSLEAMEAYLDGRYDWALAQFQEILETTPTDSLARVGQVMALRRTGEDSLAIVRVKAILRDNPRDAAAAIAYSDLLQPNMRWKSPLSNADSCWFWARRSVALDSNATDAWMSYWVEATMRAQDSLADRAIRHLARLGQWTPATQAMNRLALEVCPPGAVLLLGGDADYLGMRELQVVNGVRRDVQLEGSLLDVPRYLRARMRAGKIPAILDSAKLEAMADDTLATATVGARLTMLLHQQGKWPVVVWSWTKGDEGWWSLLALSRVTMIHRILDGKGDTATASDNAAGIRKLLELDPTVFAGPAASARDMSPIRRGAARHAGNFYLLATSMLFQEREAGRKETAARLDAWRGRLEAAVPSDDQEFRATVQRLKEIEAQHAQDLKSERKGKSGKGKAKAKR